MNAEILIELTYLLSAILFVVGLKRLQSPATARAGNALAAFAMLLAVVATLVETQILSWSGIVIGMAVGGLVGGVAARTVQMTSMPQLVGLFNGSGGGASALVAVAEFLGNPGVGMGTTGVTILLGTLIGGVTLTGSFIAFAKLQEVMTGNPITFPGQNALNAILFVGVLALGWATLSGAGGLDPLTAFYFFCGLSALLGVLLVIPIGGADMPVAIALLNSYSGLAGAATGFVLNNTVLIIAGSLVGASGIILTQIMCKAMNRSLINVIFGVFTVEEDKGKADEIYAGKIKATTAEEIAMLFDGARRVIIVPGYGMAVAQAQHALREMADKLKAEGVEVKYAIHPVAGRMPGHMNVLLAEASVPYEQLKEMEEINPDFSSTDVVLVVGANDVVNPVARTNPDSPIYGMPILDADKAQNVIVIKRGQGAGFSGIENHLFYADNTRMLYGDGQKAVSELIAGIKQL